MKRQKIREPAEADPKLTKGMADDGVLEPNT